MSKHDDEHKYNNERLALACEKFLMLFETLIKRQNICLAQSGTSLTLEQWKEINKTCDLAQIELERWYRYKKKQRPLNNVEWL